MQPEREWAKLRRRYRKLPGWTWLTANFRIKLEAGSLAENIKQAVIDKLDHIAKDIIEPIISGSESYCCWFERRMLSDAEKEALFKIYQALNALLWAGNRLTVDFSERAFADWLADVKEKLETLKPQMAKLFGKLAASWERYKREAAETVYHG